MGINKIDLTILIFDLFKKITLLASTPPCDNTKNVVNTDD